MNPFKPLLKKLPPAFRNRYYLVLGIFVFWMVFIDKHDIMTQWKLRETVKKQEADLASYKKQLIEIQQDKLDNERNKDKFAREHFYMHAPDEDVFIIEQE